MDTSILFAGLIPTRVDEGAKAAAISRQARVAKSFSKLDMLSDILYRTVISFGVDYEAHNTFLDTIWSPSCDIDDFHDD
jgi:hypothetical protein